MFEIGPEFLISVQTGYFSGFPEPWAIRLSTFMSKFDIYIKVSMLINYKTKQQSDLAWNISLTSSFCDIGIRFCICLSLYLSIRLSNIYVEVRHLRQS